MDKKQLDAIHLNTWTRFNSNMGALYSFFVKVSEIADQLDKERVEKITTDLARLFRQDPEIIKEDLVKYIPSIDELDVYPDVRNEDSVKEMMSAFQDSDFLDEISEWELRHPYKSRKFLKILYSVYNDPPITGILLRKSMLITLIIFSELLFGDLFISYYLSQGESSDNAHKHANELLVGGWGKRLTNLKVIGLVVKAQSKYKSEIIEIAKRRNLLVHNDGVVDEKYIRNAPQKYKSLSLGSILVVSTRYFRRAIDILYTLGFLLCMENWRMNQINERVRIQKLDEFVISLLDQHRYSLVIELTKNLIDVDVAENVKQRMFVNRAIAFRELGNEKEVGKIVAKLSNSDHDWQTDVAISMLCNNYPELKSQLARASEIHGSIIKLITWPLFDPIKDETWFKILCSKRSKKDLQRFNRSRHKK